MIPLHVPVYDMHETKLTAWFDKRFDCMQPKTVCHMRERHVTQSTMRKKALVGYGFVFACNGKNIKI